MELRFQPSLIQEVIDAFIEKTEREGDPTFYKEFHELADPIYENFPLDNREPEFQKLYQYLFGHWGFADIIDHAFTSFPSSRDASASPWFAGCSRRTRNPWTSCGSGGPSKRTWPNSLNPRVSRESG